MMIRWYTVRICAPPRGTTPPQQSHSHIFTTFAHPDRQDLYQYLINNHPFVGIFLYHPLHPVRIGTRILTFLASIIFGLTITNIIYMVFVLEHQQFDKTVFNMTTTLTSHGISTTTGNAALDRQFSQLQVTNGMIALWTVGAALNALYDNLIWSVAACACCLEGGRYEHLLRYRKFMPLIVMFLVVGTAAAATLVVLLVAAARSSDTNQQTAKLLGIHYDPRVQSYRFILAYGVEVLLSLAVWYPVVGALLFSGVLGCGRMPIFGGRPYEMRVLEKEKMADEPFEQGQEITLSGSGKVNLDDAV